MVSVYYNQPPTTEWDPLWSSPSPSPRSFEQQQQQQPCCHQYSSGDYNNLREIFMRPCFSSFVDEHMRQVFTEEVPMGGYYAQPHYGRASSPSSFEFDSEYEDSYTYFYPATVSPPAPLSPSETVVRSPLAGYPLPALPMPPMMDPEHAVMFEHGQPAWNPQHALLLKKTTSKPLKRSAQNRLVWTKELHRLFLRALDELGLDATPKAILSHMDVSELTRENVSSHLQKFRQRKAKEAQNKILAASPLPATNTKRKKTLGTTGPLTSAKAIRKNKAPKLPTESSTQLAN